MAKKNKSERKKQQHKPNYVAAFLSVIKDLVMIFYYSYKVFKD